MLWQFQVNSEVTQSYIHMYQFSPKWPPIQAATQHWAEFHMLYSKSMVAIHFKRSSVYMYVPNSPTFPPPKLSPQQL